MTPVSYDVDGALPQTFGVPPAPQVCGAVQVPQLETVRALPQLSVPLTWPQLLPSRAQKAGSVSGVQAPPTWTLQIWTEPASTVPRALLSDVALA